MLQANKKAVPTLSSPQHSKSEGVSRLYVERISERNTKWKVWPRVKKLEKLSLYSRCKSKEKCSCKGWKDPHTSSRESFPRKSIVDMNTLCHSCQHSLASHVSNVENHTDDELDDLLCIVADIEAVFTCKLREKDDHIKRLYYEMYKLLRQSIFDLTKPVIPKSLGTPPFESPEIKKGLENILLKFHDKPKSERHVMQELSKLFLRCLNTMKIEDLSAWRKRFPSQNPENYKRNYERWFCFCHVPIFCPSLQRYEASEIFGRTFLKSIFPLMHEELLEKFCSEEWKNAKDTKRIIADQFPRFLSMLKKEINNVDTSIWDLDLKSTSTAQISESCHNKDDVASSSEAVQNKLVSLRHKKEYKNSLNSVEKKCESTPKTDEEMYETTSLPDKKTYESISSSIENVPKTVSKDTYEVECNSSETVSEPSKRLYENAFKSTKKVLKISPKMFQRTSKPIEELYESTSQHVENTSEFTLKQSKPAPRPRKRPYEHTLKSRMAVPAIALKSKGDIRGSILKSYDNSLKLLENEYEIISNLIQEMVKTVSEQSKKLAESMKEPKPAAKTSDSSEVAELEPPSKPKITWTRFCNQNTEPIDPDNEEFYRNSGIITEAQQRVRRSTIDFVKGLGGPARDRAVRLRERRGALHVHFVVHTLDLESGHEHVIWLMELRNIFTRNLPQMFKPYITKLVYDERHRNLIVVDNQKVVGGICFRMFPSQGFSEIVFVAISKDQQVKGYGTHMMNHLKEYHRQRKMYNFLTCADKFAIGYFEKQGFSDNVTLDENVYINHIRFYKNTILMHCQFAPNIQYTNLSYCLELQLQMLKIMAEQKKIAVREFSLLDKDMQEACFPVSNDQDESVMQIKVLFRKLAVVFEQIRSHSCSYPFRQPVTEEEAPGYFEKVLEPMDLQQVKRRLISGYYTDKLLFVNDMEKIFKNCKLYYSSDSDYYRCACMLEIHFKNKMECANLYK